MKKKLYRFAQKNRKEVGKEVKDGRRRDQEQDKINEGN